MLINCWIFFKFKILALSGKFCLMDPIRICICSMKDPDPDPGGRPWYGLTGMRSGILFLSPCVLCSILCLGKMKCSVFSFVPCLPGEIYCCIWGLCGQSPSPPPSSREEKQYKIHNKYLHYSVHCTVQGRTCLGYIALFYALSARVVLYCINSIIL